MADPNKIGDGAEAEAQATETIMPWIWGVMGLGVIAVFVVAVMLTTTTGHVVRHPPAAAPLTRPPDQHA